MKPRNAAEVLPFLPMAVRNRLEELAATVVHKCGDALASIVLHGSAVRGGYVAGTSNVNVVIVLHSDPPALLEKLGPALRLAHAAARIECTILRADEIARSADVFPLLYADIRDGHALVHGSDPFDALDIKPEHRRLRVEQELREATLALRKMLAYDGLTGAPLAAAIEHLVKRLRPALRALLQLHGDETRDEVDRVLAAVGKRLDVNTLPLLSPAKDASGALETLKLLLERATRDVDTLVVAR